MTMRLYDTARQDVVPFEPGPLVSMYTCGITPYDSTHLGHASTFVFYGSARIPEPSKADALIEAAATPHQREIAERLKAKSGYYEEARRLARHGSRRSKCPCGQAGRRRQGAGTVIRYKQSQTVLGRMPECRERRDAQDRPGTGLRVPGLVHIWRNGYSAALRSARSLSIFWRSRPYSRALISAAWYFSIKGTSASNGL